MAALDHLHDAARVWALLAPHPEGLGLKAIAQALGLPTAEARQRVLRLEALLGLPPAGPRQRRFALPSGLPRVVACLPEEAAALERACQACEALGAPQSQALRSLQRKLGGPPQRRLARHQKVVSKP